MKDFLTFKKMIAPVVIQSAFWLGVLGCVISGLLIIFAPSNTADLNQRIGGVFLILIGPIGVRVWCELLIVIFKIHESLLEIKNK